MALPFSGGKSIIICNLSTEIRHVIQGLPPHGHWAEEERCIVVYRHVLLGVDRSEGGGNSPIHAHGTMATRPSRPSIPRDDSIDISTRDSQTKPQPHMRRVSVSTGIVRTNRARDAVAKATMPHETTDHKSVSSVLAACNGNKSKRAIII